jgi:hypothetical protein
MFKLRAHSWLDYRPRSALSIGSFAQQVYISNEPKMSLQLLNMSAQPATLTTLYKAPPNWTI